jgi:hypothetical protein
VLNQGEIIEDIDSEKCNGSNQYSPFHIASGEKSGEMKYQYNDSSNIDNVKNHNLPSWV